MISFSVTAASRFLWRAGFRRFDRAAGFLPGAEAALDMGDGLETHALSGLRGQRRAQAAGAEKHEAFVLGKNRLVIGALRVDPELQHAARAVKRARHLAIALQFADIANI